MCIIRFPPYGRCVAARNCETLAHTTMHHGLQKLNMTTNHAFLSSFFFWPSSSLFSTLYVPPFGLHHCRSVALPVGQYAASCNFWTPTSAPLCTYILNHASSHSFLRLINSHMTSALPLCVHFMCTSSSHIRAR